MRLSLEGLSVGDAFGEQFFIEPSLAEELTARRALPECNLHDPDRWHYTDDTLMALSVFECLRRFGRIEQDHLAASIAEHYDMRRGYGPAMHNYLARLRDGVSWRDEAPALFGGRGSFGNGSAMRAAPIGAYFADNVELAANEAAKSAVVTHSHPEAIAGAVAVAVAGAVAASGDVGQSPDGFLVTVSDHIPDSEVRVKIGRARRLGDCSLASAVARLGNGVNISCQDTVPLALWCAARHLNSYEDALWLTVSALGDRDTTCAIVGGIVAVSAGAAAIPARWLSQREELPDWPFAESGQG